MLIGEESQPKEAHRIPTTHTSSNDIPLVQVNIMNNQSDSE